MFIKKDFTQKIFLYNIKANYNSKIGWISVPKQKKSIMKYFSIGI